MKSNVIILAIISILFLGLIACGGNTAQNANTHTHADGTVHSDHAPEKDAPKQEAFKIEGDSITVVADTTKHDCENCDHNHAEEGHDHDHEGHDHKH